VANGGLLARSDRSWLALDEGDLAVRGLLHLVALRDLFDGPIPELAAEDVAGLPAALPPMEVVGDALAIGVHDGHGALLDGRRDASYDVCPQGHGPDRRTADFNPSSQVPPSLNRERPTGTASDRAFTMMVGLTG